MDETSFVQPRWSQSAAAPRLVVGDGDPVGELLSRLAQPFSSYCSKSVGPGFKGILTSDRYSAYNWLAVSQRQVWAHLKRDFTQIAERAGASAEVGALLSRRNTCLPCGIKSAMAPCLVEI